MKPLREWRNTPEVVRLKGMTPGELYGVQFSRNPFRRIYIDPTLFYAPADGIVLYAHADIGPEEPIVWVKGKNFTVRDLLDDKEFNERSLVVGIFMTQYDVHINRVPTNGSMKEEHRTPYLFTPNISMKPEEDALLEEGKLTTAEMGYLLRNERRIVSIFAPALKARYYLVQIAEKDVDQICNFDPGIFTQGDRYGNVLYGSQLDMVLPVNGAHKYELLVQRGLHVEAGIDPVVRIKRNANRNQKQLPED